MSFNTIHENKILAKILNFGTITSITMFCVCGPFKFWQDCRCTGSTQPSLVAYVKSPKISYADSIYSKTCVKRQLKNRKK